MTAEHNPVIEQALNDLNWGYKTFSKGYLISCPNKAWHKTGDSHYSCAVWPAFASGRFKCYGCGYSGTISELFENTDANLPEFWDLGIPYVRDNSNVELDEEILTAFRRATPEDLKTPAFKHRNWDSSVLEDLDLRFDDRNQNMVFPVRSPELVGAVGRSAQGKVIHNYFGFFTGNSLGCLDRLTDRPKLAIVEGWTCIGNCYKWAADLDFDVVCTFTANVSSQQAQMLCDTGKRLEFWFDQDAAGRKGLEQAEAHIDDLIFSRTWDPKFGDIGSMSKKTFYDIMV